MNKNITVINKKEYIVRIKGKYKFAFNELISFENGTKGIVIKSETGFADVALFDDDINNPVNIGENVNPSGNSYKLHTSRWLLGTIIDISGNVISRFGNFDKKIEDDKWHKERYVFEQARTIYSRDFIDDKLDTGTAIIDWSIPIGKGQRELILGDRKTGKTTLALNMILAQKDTGVNCIYVAIGQKQTSLQTFVRAIKDGGMSDRVTIVSAPPGAVATQRYLSPYIGMTLAEHIQKEYGEDNLVIFDDLSKHAESYREISLLFETTPAREAYPGDIFYLHSSLLERAGKFNQDFGGGSISAIPIIQTENGDISSFVSTNVISITDGQIFTSKDMFNANQRPAINVPYSVSRIGSSVQTPLVRSLAGKIKFLVSRYNETQKMRKISGFLSPENKEIIRKGDVLFNLIKQGASEVISYDMSSILLFLFQEGYLNFIDQNDRKTMNTMKDVLNEYINEIETGKKLSVILSSEKLDNELFDVFMKLEILPRVKHVILNSYPKLEEDKEFKELFGSIRNDFVSMFAYEKKIKDAQIQENDTLSSDDINSVSLDIKNEEKDVTSENEEKGETNE